LEKEKGVEVDRFVLKRFFFINIPLEIIHSIYNMDNTADETTHVVEVEKVEVQSTGDEGTIAATTEPLPPDTDSSSQKRGLKVLFLSLDTGGGHRASAESLGKQFQLLFPGTTYDLLDVVEKDGVPPYNSLVRYYKHLSGHPSQWKLVYSVSNSRAFELLADAHLKLMCERAVRKSIQSYNPDVVVSVHPLMTNVPVLSCSKISQETGKHLPMFTVVTDLGSAHCLWFANGVEKMFVGSEKVKELAMSRGKVPEEKLVLAGLPIRHDFAVQSENMGDRTSPEGREYQRKVRQDLQLPYADRKTILMMGGGEGVGSLGNMTDAIYVELVTQGIDALVLVICGRNEKLRTQIESRDWNAVIHRWRTAKDTNGYGSSLMALSDACGPVVSSTGCDGPVTDQIRRMLLNGMSSTSNAVQFPLTTMGFKDKEDEKKAENDTSLQVDNSFVEPSKCVDKAGVALVESLESKPGNVTVIGLGFIENMAEYMVAADVLVSKAGPGTISEAAAVSLPIILTSFLPGQEEGNVNYVVDGGFGAYCPDTDPISMAEELCIWLKDDDKLSVLSKAAKTFGAPYAARDIVKSIGESTLKWREENEEQTSSELQKS
jgi:UDP-N-acetylglucosamine:LPS N-acetylglucosamine transferase